MNKYNEIIHQLKCNLEDKGEVSISPSLEVSSHSEKYRPDLIYKNIDSDYKVIIEIKNNENNLNISLGTLSYLMDFKQFLDSKNDYKFVVIFTDQLTPNISKLIQGRIIYYSLKENSLEEISELIYKTTLPNSRV